MNEDTDDAVYAQRTTLDPNDDELEMGAWVPPIKCEGCEGRVDTFMRYTPNLEKWTEAICSGCGATWELNKQE